MKPEIESNEQGERKYLLARRSVLMACAAVGASQTLGAFSPMSVFASESNHGSIVHGKKTHIAVVGAGAFGGWTALYLLRRGARVTLVDAWGPGNSRASSGGETRIIRGTYGPDGIYTRMAARALKLWKENETRWSLKLFHPTGMLWMAGGDDRFEKAALPHLRDAGLTFEELTTPEAAKRYPQINFEGVKWALFEKDAGYLTARRACEAVLVGFQAEGGEYRELAVESTEIKGGEMQGVRLSDGATLTADAYVFACGPWLGKLFPQVLGGCITPTRQEVFFFGPAGGDTRFFEGGIPVWIDNGPRLFYGIPGNQWRGFKLADDTRGPEFDPTSGERVPTREGIEAARKYLAFRFPALKDAPLSESRVCQYEQSPDGQFIIDRHPQASNVWIVGGGSGHGFKHGPAIGEMVSELVLSGKSADPFFSLSRLSKS
jgi:glycine/D-amino acid oxidase-like deaminating enzyme